MPRNTAVLIPSTAHSSLADPHSGGIINFSGDRYRGDGYYGYADGLHTVSYFVSGFVGILKIQATLATDPEESDWFDVDGTEYGDGTNPVSTAVSRNFNGNFVWIRAAVSDFAAGVINKVQYIN